MANAAHHQARSYRRRAEAIRAAANADPNVKCWRCGRTLDEHPPHADGASAVWTAGHTIDGDNASPLMPEASTCNYSAGATAGNRARAVDRDAELVEVAKRWRG